MISELVGGPKEKNLLHCPVPEDLLLKVRERWQDIVRVYIFNAFPPTQASCVEDMVLTQAVAGSENGLISLEFRREWWWKPRLGD